MVLNASEVAGNTGHVADHNVIATYVNTHDDVDAATTAHHHTLGTGANQAAAGTHTHPANPALEGTTAPPNTNTTGGVLGTATTAAHSDHGHAIGAHDHSTTAKGGTLAQSAITKTIRVPHTYSFYGNSLSATGVTPPFTVPLPSGQTATLAIEDYGTDSGTATIVVQSYSGGGWNTVSTLSVSSTAGRTSPAFSVPACGLAAYPNTGLFRLNVTAVSSPVNCYVTLHIDYAV